jgi:hypothetical protein
MKVDSLKPSFVAEIPESLKPGILYLALEYDAMAHLCACGCGNEVATPISPTDWRIAWNGVGITVHPSIGSGSLACRSHYVIEASRIRWCAPMSDRDVAWERAQTASAKGLSPCPQAPETKAYQPADRPSAQEGAPWYARLLKRVWRF